MIILKILFLEQLIILVDYMLNVQIHHMVNQLVQKLHYMLKMVLQLIQQKRLNVVKENGLQFLAILLKKLQTELVNISM